MAFNDPYHQLYKAIVASKYGLILVKNVRFGRFKPTSIAIKTWERILGPDVNNLHHMWFTKKLTDAFVSHSPKSQFSQREIHLLRLSATFHDLAESIVGDIPKIHKNLADEQQEKIILIQIINALSKKQKAIKVFKSDILYSIEHILFPSSPTRLSQAFAAIEYLGYLHTACAAKIAVNLRTKKNPTYLYLNQLANEVIPNSLTKLRLFAPPFPAINRIISHTNPYRDTLNQSPQRKPDYDHLQILYPTL